MMDDDNMLESLGYAAVVIFVAAVLSVLSMSLAYWMWSEL